MEGNKEGVREVRMEGSREGRKQGGKEGMKEGSVRKEEYVCIYLRL